MTWIQICFYQFKATSFLSITPGSIYCSLSENKPAREAETCIPNGRGGGGFRKVKVCIWLIRKTITCLKIKTQLQVYIIWGTFEFDHANKIAFRSNNVRSSSRTRNRRVQSSFWRLQVSSASFVFVCSRPESLTPPVVSRKLLTKNYSFWPIKVMRMTHAAAII